MANQALTSNQKHARWCSPSELQVTQVMCTPILITLADLAKHYCQHLAGFTIAAFLDMLDDPNCLHARSTGKTSPAVKDLIPIKSVCTDFGKYPLTPVE